MLLNPFCEFSITPMPELQTTKKEESTTNQTTALINIHTKTLSEILANQRQHVIKKSVKPMRGFPGNVTLIVLKII